MRFLAEVARIGGSKEEDFAWWIGLFGGETLRHRLHGWRLWQSFCVENEFEPQNMDTPQYLIKDTLPAIKDLFSLVNTAVVLLLNGNTILKSMIRAITAGTKRGSKYRRIWKLEVVLDFIRKGKPYADLPWRCGPKARKAGSGWGICGDSREGED
jgi:hypothetical protein